MEVTVDPRRQFFDELAPHWHHTAEEQQHTAEKVLEALRPRPGQRILDVGTGTGELAQWILRRTGGGAEVWAMDLSGQMLRQARLRANGIPLRLCQADAHFLPFPACCFDGIAMLAVFAHLRDQRRALEEACRVLRPGGRLVVAHPLGSGELAHIHRRAGGPVARDLLPSANTLQSWLLGCRFQVLDYVDRTGLFLVLAERRAD